MLATTDHLEATRPLIERTIGRQLRAAEQIVDVFRITRLLDEAKDDLDAAIRREQKRAVQRALRLDTRTNLKMTAVMLKPLYRLYQAGRREAAAELERAGYVLPRKYANPHRDHMLEAAEAKLRAKLAGLSIRITNEHTVQLQLADRGAVGDALAQALLDVLGSRSIASDLVSTAMFSGMGATFEENQDLVGGWEYSAVLDGGTCDDCDSKDGTTYESWDDLQDDLPDGGPNPDCYGGDRCRCRALPAPA